MRSFRFAWLMTKLFYTQAYGETWYQLSPKRRRYYVERTLEWWDPREVEWFADCFFDGYVPKTDSYEIW